MDKIEHSQTYKVSSGTTAGNIKAWLSGIPEDAKVSVDAQSGDWSYSDTHSLRATWSTEVGYW